MGGSDPVVGERTGSPEPDRTPCEIEHGEDGPDAGARYKLEGGISSIVKRSNDVKDVYYLFDLSLINMMPGAACAQAKVAVADLTYPSDSAPSGLKVYN